MTPHQKGITELVGVFKERFGILITADEAEWIVARAKLDFLKPRWNAYGNTSGQPDMERKA